MTYEQAIKVASFRAVKMKRDFYVNECEDGCFVSEQYSGDTIYVAEPSYDSAIIAGIAA